MRWGRSTSTTATAPAATTAGAGPGSAPSPGAAPQEVQALATPARAARSLDSLGGMDGADGSGMWFFSRVVDGDYTILDGRRVDMPDSVGQAFPWSSTICSTMLPAEPSVSAERVAARGDLSVRPYDLAWEAGERWGVRSYVGAALRGPYGEVTGTLCRISRSTLQVDPHLVVAVGDRAAALERSLANDLRRAEQARGADLEEVASATDPLTRLPGRAAWGLLLEREEQRARALAGPTGLVLVDTGHVRTVRGLRRVVDAVAEVVGDGGTTCRLGPRQLGVLCTDRSKAQVERLGAALRASLETDGRGGSAAWASRRGLHSLQAAWEEAEAGLLGARRAAAGLVEGPTVALPAPVELPAPRREAGSARPRTSVG